MSQPKQEIQKKLMTAAIAFYQVPSGEKPGNDFYKHKISLFSAFGYHLS